MVELDFDSQEQLSAFRKSRTAIRTSSLSRREILPPHGSGFGSQGFGIAEKPLNIEPWSGQTLSVSGVARVKTHVLHPYLNPTTNPRP